MICIIEIDRGTTPSPRWWIIATGIDDAINQAMSLGDVKLANHLVKHAINLKPSKYSLPPSPNGCDRFLLVSEVKE
jgi:hypothetical protein